MVILNLQVEADGDDGRHQGGVHTFDHTDAGVIGNAISTAQWGIMARIDLVTIPAGATIDVAYLTVTAWGSESTGGCNAVITADLALDPDAPTTEAEWEAQVDGTVAEIAWSNIGNMTIDVEYNSASIVTLVQELIDQASWASGNAMCFFIHDQASASSSNAKRFTYFHADDNTKAVKLHVEYSPPTGPSLDKGHTSVHIKQFWFKGAF